MNCGYLGSSASPAMVAAIGLQDNESHDLDAGGTALQEGKTGIGDSIRIYVELSLDSGWRGDWRG